jgi:hypothetical protein
VDVYRLLPRELQDLFGSDPVTVFGYDAVDRFIGQYLTLPQVELGDRIPAGCIVSIYICSGVSPAQSLVGWSRSLLVTWLVHV